jgi:predicted methyltransferase
MNDLMKFRYKGCPVLSNNSLNEIKQALNRGAEFLEITPDLGISRVKIQLCPKEYSFSIQEHGPIKFPAKFNEKEKVCYAIYNNAIYPLKTFSEVSNFYYKLVPTSWRPILRISATQMHKKPFLDFLEKEKLKGFVLDAGTGLGYSAIIASKTANNVITIEWDKQVIDIAAFNPHSRALFESMNIKLVHGDLSYELLKFDDNYFNNIIQDGGMPKSSGEFFSQRNCNHLYRILCRGGHLYFYLPQHGKSKGRDFGAEHINRLNKAGFFLKKRYIEGSFAVFYKP